MVVRMYQLVTTVREYPEGYQVSARLSELLPGGGVAPLASREAVYPYAPERAISDPFVGILQLLQRFAQDTLHITVDSANSGLF